MANSSGTCVINSNKRMEERMKELGIETPKDPVPECLEQEFLPGLEAERIMAESKATSEEIIRLAQDEAERILSEAKKRADDIMRDAAKKAQDLFEEQKQAGYQDGTQQAEAFLERECKRFSEEVTQEKHSLQMDYEQRLKSMESDIVDAIIRVFDKVFRIQFGEKKEILLALIENTLMNIESVKNFRIRVSKTNQSFLEENVESLREHVGKDVTIEIVNDNNLKDLDCMIETDFGVFDCGLDTELSGLEKDIRSLCD